MKQNIHILIKDFKEAKANTEGEQHVCITSPNRDVEQLAYMLNEYIAEYFAEQSAHKRAVKAIRDEITNLSHDLRTPLTSILGYMEYLEDGELSKEQQEALEVIKRRSYYLNQLIEDLYEYARLENNEYVMDLQKMDIYKLLKEHLLGFYAEFEQSGIDLELALPKESKPIWINGDIKCVERVLHNLSANAIKYSGGKLKVSLEHEGKYVKFTYQTLRGELTEYDITHLLDRFYKKELNRGKGTGLGLTIAKRYTEQMGGSVEIYGGETYLYMTFYFVGM